LCAGGKQLDSAAVGALGAGREAGLSIGASPPPRQSLAAQACCGLVHMPTLGPTRSCGTGFQVNLDACGTPSLTQLGAHTYIKVKKSEELARLC